ncbi:MAG: HK97 family phage prohead protease [Ignavibacteriae bacterium]|nr:HK97 family phage prohead protease [Ignavibacteriota bacterium]
MHLLNLETMPVDQRRQDIALRILQQEPQAAGLVSLSSNEKLFSAQAVEARARAVNEHERSITYVFTSSAIDRFQEIVDPNGADMRSFRQAKRTVFWNHNYNFPIGRSLWEKQEGEKWVGKVQFAGETDMARDIWNLAKSGYVGMTSIGFIPAALEITTLGELKDLQPVNRTDFDPTTSIWVWRKWELLEYSIVGIGANPEAVEYEKILRNGLVQSDILRNMMIAEIQEKRLCDLESCKERMTEMPDMLARLLNRIETLESQITPAKKQRDFAESAQQLPSNQVGTAAETQILTREQLEELTRSIVRGAVSRMKGRVS